MTHSLTRQILRTAAAVAGLLCLPVADAAATGFVTIHTFDPLGEGNTPYPVLLQGADGFLYGNTSAGGLYSNGSLFRLNTNGTSFSVLYAFPGTNAGSQPRGGLVQARDGNFYGTTYAGGAASEGTLFQLTPTGVFTYLGSFTDGDSPGANPGGTLVEAPDGFLYGTAQYGGRGNFGTVYRFAASPAFVAPATFVTFTGDVGGSYPQSDLILGKDGNLYGTTTLGGQYGNGTFFRVSTAGTGAILYSFSGSGDGGRPFGGVVQGSDGAFYGAARTGGSAGAGLVYRIVVNGDIATENVLHEFAPGFGEGANPNGLLLFASDGNFYGTTTTGGAFNNGGVYQVTPGGVYTTVYSFANNGDGGSPLGGVIQGSDGRLYGTTAPVNGAAATVFQLDLGLPFPAPAPTGLLNNRVAVGETLRIQGRNFVGTTAVTFAAANNKTVDSTILSVLSGTTLTVKVPPGAVTGVVTVKANGRTGTVPGTLTVYPAFFAGEVALSNNVYYLSFPSGNLFGYYTFLTNPNYLYHFDLGYEYVFAANDGKSGVYFYDFASNSFFYTSPTFPFPYLYDFESGAVLYYFPDTTKPGHYTSSPRYFYNFGTGQVITK